MTASKARKIYILKRMNKSNEERQRRNTKREIKRKKRMKARQDTI